MLADVAGAHGDNRAKALQTVAHLWRASIVIVMRAARASVGPDFTQGTLRLGRVTQKRGDYSELPLSLCCWKIIQTGRFCGLESNKRLDK